MGVPTSEVGYTAMARREDNEVHKDMWWHWILKKIGFKHTPLLGLATVVNSKMRFTNMRQNYILRFRGKITW